jgi:hypothetical protein
MSVKALVAIRVVEASHADTGGGVQEIDFGSRGTRHRAAATYAAEHPAIERALASPAAKAAKDVPCFDR